jgi:hypothetical protein
MQRYCFSFCVFILGRIDTLHVKGYLSRSVPERTNATAHVLKELVTIVIGSPDLRSNHNPARNKTKMTAEPD